MDSSQKKAAALGYLERICVALELTPTQYGKAKSGYESVGEWLDGSADPTLKRTLIYPQGSVALGTTVKPHGRNEYDVDLVCFVPGVSAQTAPYALKDKIGKRLGEHGTYAKMLKEKTRCWRLDYSDDFHMDITPAIRNPACPNGGELVPDKNLRDWKPSNPKGYQKLFEKRAQLQPRMRYSVGGAVTDKRAGVEPFPTHKGNKTILHRVVQLSKRHRDIMFDRQPDVAPISVILTTLAARSYEQCVSNNTYEDEFDLLCDVIRRMPNSIQRGRDRRQWFIWNETTTTENFAEKWNSEPKLSAAFFRWHTSLLEGVETLTGLSGEPAVDKHLSGLFGDRPVALARQKNLEAIVAARDAGTLYVAPVVGVTTLAKGVGTVIKPNTFYGREK